MTPEIQDLLLDIQLKLNSVQQVLKGYDGTKGICALFEEHIKDEEDFRSKFYSFRLFVFVTLALMTGGSGFGLAKLMELAR